jgi:hypothetical protein
MPRHPERGRAWILNLLVAALDVALLAPLRRRLACRRLLRAMR